MKTEFSKTRNKNKQNKNEHTKLHRIYKGTNIETYKGTHIRFSVRLRLRPEPLADTDCRLV